MDDDDDDPIPVDHYPHPRPIEVILHARLAPDHDRTARNRFGLGLVRLGARVLGRHASFDIRDTRTAPSLLRPRPR